MSKLRVVLAALAIGGAIGIVYGAQGAVGFDIVASADTKDVQCAGPHPNEPGTRNDPCGAQQGAKPAGGTVQSAGPHPEEPGIRGDPISAEKPAKATGGGVKVAPAEERNPNPVPPKQ